MQQCLALATPLGLLLSLSLLMLAFPLTLESLPSSINVLPLRSDPCLSRRQGLYRLDGGELAEPHAVIYQRAQESASGISRRRDKSGPMQFWLALALREYD